MNAIKLNNISVKFPIQTIKSNNDKKSLFDFFKTTPEESFLAISNFNLEINTGDRVGLVGLNGAGKSTLLKVMAGIYAPSSGSVITNGKISALFDLSTGFEMELNAIENIKIRLLFLGFSKNEISILSNNIINFAELGEFIYQPIKTYSAGMFLRLAFSVSTSINPEILLADEIIGAGDHIFARKAQQRLKEFMDDGKTSVLATHSTELIHAYCNRVIWMNKGSIIMDGKVDQVIPAYLAGSK